MSEVNELLKESGAEMVRHRKHLVYRLPNGKNFVQPSTPSDSRRGEKNSLCDLKKALGVQEPKGEPGERRPRRIKGQLRPVRERIEKADMNPSLADQLRLKGATEAALQAKIDILKAEKCALETALEGEQSRLCQSWWCRLKRWTSRNK